MFDYFRYNMIFKFLLRVRRIQTALHECWVDSMDTKSLPDQFCKNTRWWLRNHMNFIVNNLQFYLQVSIRLYSFNEQSLKNDRLKVDVIEWEFSELIEKINKTMDFEQVSIAHDAFVTSLLTKSFLLTKPVSKSNSDVRHVFVMYFMYCFFYLLSSDIKLYKDYTRSLSGIHEIN